MINREFWISLASNCKAVSDTTARSAISAKWSVCPVTFSQPHLIMRWCLTFSLSCILRFAFAVVTATMHMSRNLFRINNPEKILHPS
jgi:hypothetical protein